MSQQGQDDRPESELLTFLFADIRGYTRFTQQHGDEAAAKLTSAFATVVRDVVPDAGGTVFELSGDEAMCVFPSPRRCLRAAVELQQRFVSETLANAGLPLTVGIGVDVGEAVRGVDGYRGGALNRAARLCSRAKAGEVLASSEVTHLAGRMDGLRSVVQDSVVLKGIAEPVRPVRVLPEGEDPVQQMASITAAAGPPRRGRWTRRRLLSVTAVGLVVAATVGWLVSAGGRTTEKALRDNSVAMLDPADGSVVDDIDVGSAPAAAAAGYGAVWTANASDDTVSRIDSATRQVATIGVGSGPSAIAVGLGAVWVANAESGTVTRIDPSTSDSHSIPVGTAPGGLAIGSGSVWVSNTGDGTVSRIDPGRNAVAQTIPVADGPSGIAATARHVWVADSASNAVSEIPLAKAGAAVAADVATIPVGNDPTGVAVLGNSVWVSNNLDATVDRLPITGTAVAETRPVGPAPTELTAMNGRLWVATQGNDAIDELDPTSGDIVRRVHLGAVPGGVAATGRQLWVTALSNPALHRGGTLHIAAVDPGPLDPDYLDTPWAIWLTAMLYDGLVDYRHTTGADAAAIVPDLATAIPAPSNGGRTYVFQLRRGIRWSTGQPVTVQDVRRGLERVIVSGISPFRTEIAGARSCTVRACNITGISAQAATNSIAITLVRPDAAFLDQLASFGPAVPAATPLPLQNSPVATTGPYRISTYQPGKLFAFSRNPDFRQWSAAAQPAGFPDRIEWRSVSAGPNVLAERRVLGEVASGAVDWTDARVAGSTPTLQARFGSRVFITPTETTHGLLQNTRLPPFDNRLARRAVAYAIDRGAVQSKWFTDATITCQVLPPDFPAYRPYCPYTLRPSSSGGWNAPDIATAQRLVRRSGTGGAVVRILSIPTWAPGLKPVVAAMNQIGYHARLVVTDNPTYFTYISDSRHKVQAAGSGWVADDVAASDFFVPLFTCNGFIPASPHNENETEFCDHSVDAAVHRALRLQASSSVAADALWATVDRRIVDAAPFIPLVNPSWVDVVSSRVENYERSPVIGVLFDQMWVY